MFAYYLGAQPIRHAGFGQGSGRIWLDNVQCTGTERSLAECTVVSSGVNSCSHAQDAGVICPPGKCFISRVAGNEG